MYDTTSRLTTREAFSRSKWTITVNQGHASEKWQIFAEVWAKCLQIVRIKTIRNLRVIMLHSVKQLHSVYLGKKKKAFYTVLSEGGHPRSTRKLHL